MQRQSLIARQVGLPVVYLHQLWGESYAPVRHFFRRARDGFLDPLWADDVPCWEKMTRGYLHWHRVDDSRHFWDVLYRAALASPAFWDPYRTKPAFRAWMFLKRFPGHTLDQVLTEMTRVLVAETVSPVHALAPAPGIGGTVRCDANIAGTPATTGARNERLP